MDSGRVNIGQRKVARCGEIWINATDDEITALLLTWAIDPVPQVRAAAGALARRVEVNGPIATHLESSLKAVARDFGWEVAQEARFLVRDLKLTPGASDWLATRSRREPDEKRSAA